MQEQAKPPHWEYQREHGPIHSPVCVHRRCKPRQENQRSKTETKKQQTKTKTTNQLTVGLHEKFKLHSVDFLAAILGCALKFGYDGVRPQLRARTKGTKRKDELPSERIYRQCHPKEIEVAFLSSTAVEFFAQDQLQRLHDLYLVSNKGLVVVDATIQNDTNPLPTRFLLKDLWMFGSTKPTSEITAVAQTHPCRYHLGLGIYNVETAVEGMEGDRRSHLLHLCGLLLRSVLIPCHVQETTFPWTRSTALSFAAELDGHVLGTLCAVTMALLTNGLDLCIQGLFGAGKSKSMAVLLLALLELDETKRLRMLFICKENSGTRSFADLLQWLEPPPGVCNRIGRLVGDQERNKSSYSHTKFDINPRERRSMLRYVK